MGASFHLKAFHTQALSLGPMALEMLEQEMSGTKLEMGVGDGE